MTKPYNILVFMADEFRPDAVGYRGHPIVKTPNLDLFAKSGTVFGQAYTPSPICVPARAALACGQYVHRLKMWDSATPYNGYPKSWMHALRDEGYSTASFGKLHFRATEDDNGFDEERLPMHVVDGIGWTIALLRDDPYPYAGGKALAAQTGIGESTYTQYDRAIIEEAVSWLHARKHSEGPWAAFVSLVCPHFPLTAPAEFASLYPASMMDWPIRYEMKDRPDHPEIVNIEKFYDYDRHFDEETVRQAKASYYGLISFVDHCFGRVMAALDASGMRDNTVILFTSDHGDMMGDHGLWTKQVMYEASVGVPMVMSGPGIEANKHCNIPVSLVDIAATITDVAGLDPLQGNCGGSLLELAAKPDDLDRTIFSEYHDGGSTTGAFMVRWDDWKYVHYVGMMPQLFNLTEDPQETENLIIPRTLDGYMGKHEGAEKAYQEGRRRLYEICNPEDVDSQCFADQRDKVVELDGREAIANHQVFDHTPTPV